MNFSQQLACVQREIAMRRSVYPKWVECGRMTQTKADYEIACMEAVEVTIKSMMPPQPKQEDLFRS